MTKEELNTYKREFNKKNFTLFKVMFSNKQDADIIEWISHLEIGKIDYLRKLIRDDIRRNKQ